MFFSDSNQKYGILKNNEVLSLNYVYVFRRFQSIFIRISLLFRPKNLFPTDIFIFLYPYICSKQQAMFQTQKKQI